MRTLSDFNDPIHRIQSASAAFQRGVYHLFVLQQACDHDIYSKVIRTYQATFQLCLTHLLLDLSFPIAYSVPARLKKRCRDPAQPTRAEIDPAALVTHSVFENRTWHPSPGSPFSSSGISALDLIGRTVEARHNLIYRPFLLERNGLHWEDCTLMQLLGDVPAPEDVLQAYSAFVLVAIDRRDHELKERDERLRLMHENADGWAAEWAKPNKNWADYFIQLQFWPYADKKGQRPTETVLMSYARMLSSADDAFLERLRVFRNDMLRLSEIQSTIRFDPEWRLGEI